MTNKTTRRFLRACSLIACALATSNAVAAPATKRHAAPPSFLVIVADDMNYDSPGFMGGVAPDVTPHLDRLATESFLFTKAHATVSVCQPSRQSMLSGKYPHRYGGIGFFPMAWDTQTVSRQLKKAGYLTAAINKLQHIKPRDAFGWDMSVDGWGEDDTNVGTLGRNPDTVRTAVVDVLDTARTLGKPFFLFVSSDDPHRPFHGQERAPEELLQTVKAPSRIYRPDEIRVPASLPDLPAIRRDLAAYASSVRRLDDTVGACLDALTASGQQDNTIVIFVSDNGMPFPLGKFDTYLESTLTPLLFRWPARYAAGKKDTTHLVSLCDLTPTILELAGAPGIPDIDGRSLVPLLERRSVQDWRRFVVATRYEDIYYRRAIASNLNRDPGYVDRLKAIGWVDRPDHERQGVMSRSIDKRAIHDGKYGYIFNHWYDGTPLQAYPYPDRTVDAIREAGQTNAVLAERAEFFTYRSQEEFNDWETDPGSWSNAIRNPAHAERIGRLQSMLLDWMKSTEDPIAADFASYLAAHSREDDRPSRPTSYKSEGR